MFVRCFFEDLIDRVRLQGCPVIRRNRIFHSTLRPVTQAVRRFDKVLRCSTASLTEEPDECIGLLTGTYREISKAGEGSSSVERLLPVHIINRLGNSVYCSI